MRWRILIPMSLITAGVLVLVLFLTVPAGSQQPPPLPACGKVSGDDCESICLRECSDGSCCHWSHYNYF